MYFLLLNSFHATIYPCPETKAQRRELGMGVMTRIEDLNTVSCIFKVVYVMVTLSIVWLVFDNWIGYESICLREAEL